MRKTLFFLTLLSAVCPLPAQDIAGALQSIEQNNKTLLALQKNREAAELELRVSTSPPSTPHAARQPGCRAKCSDRNTPLHAATCSCRPKASASTWFTRKVLPLCSKSAA